MIFILNLFIYLWTPSFVVAMPDPSGQSVICELSFTDDFELILNEAAQIRSDYETQRSIPFENRTLKKGYLIRNLFEWIKSSIDSHKDKLTGGVNGESAAALQKLWQDVLEPMFKQDRIDHLRLLQAVDRFAVLISDQPQLINELKREDLLWDERSWMVQLASSYKGNAHYLLSTPLRNFVSIPMPIALSPRKLLLLWANGVNPLGLTSKNASFDSYLQPPYDLLRHDQFHAVSGDTNLTIDFEESVRFVANYFLWVDSHRAKKDRVLRDLWLFEIFHELLPLPTVQFDAASALNILKNFSIEHLVARMEERIKGKHGYRRAFSELPSHDEVIESLKDVIQKLKSLKKTSSAD